MTNRSRLFSFLHFARARYWRVVSPRTVGVRAVVVDDDGKVLLVRHSYGAMGWHLPGGGVKRREHLATAVLRELREEAGVRGDPDSLELFGAYSNLAEGKSDHIVAFVVKRWESVDGSDAEIVEQGFFDPNGPPADVSPGTARRLGELAHGSARSFTW